MKGHEINPHYKKSKEYYDKCKYKPTTKDVYDGKRLSFFEIEDEFYSKNIKNISKRWEVAREKLEGDGIGELILTFPKPNKKK